MRLAKAVPPGAGLISRETVQLRGRRFLTDAERRQAKRMRKRGVSFEVIATTLEHEEEEVRHDVANVRSPRANPPRYSLNVSPAAAAWFKRQQHPGEPMWQTVNRVCGIV